MAEDPPAIPAARPNLMRSVSLRIPTPVSFSARVPRAR